MRATDVLCRVQTDEEVKEYCGAFMQVYREEARYLERTAPWVERVGLTYIKRRVVEDEPGARPCTNASWPPRSWPRWTPGRNAPRGQQAHEFAPLAEVVL